MKDVRLPQQLQRAMAAEAEAGREAKAKVSISDHYFRTTSPKYRQIRLYFCICEKDKLFKAIVQRFFLIEPHQVIGAEGEQRAARALKDASDIISQSPAALQLRYLQTLTTIAAERNSTIIFPLPMELMQCFMRN